MLPKSSNNNYRQLLDKQRPQHHGDAFSIRHPKMPTDKRAKLFMPFDALRGFDAAIDIAQNDAESIDPKQSSEKQSSNHKKPQIDQC